MNPWLKDGRIAIENGNVILCDICPCLSAPGDCANCSAASIHSQMYVKISGITGTDSFLNGEWILGPPFISGNHTINFGCLWCIALTTAGGFPTNRAIQAAVQYFDFGGTRSFSAFVQISNASNCNGLGTNMARMTYSPSPLWSIPIAGAPFPSDCSPLWGAAASYTDRAWPGGTPPTGYSGITLDAISWA